MDPFVTCTHQGFNHKTIIHKGGGKNPVWNSTFDIPIKSLGDELHFFVKDNGFFGDSEIG
jgi:Ca2+-dependent lipid-binding protein